MNINNRSPGAMHTMTYNNFYWGVLRETLSYCPLSQYECNRTNRWLAAGLSMERDHLLGIVFRFSVTCCLLHKIYSK